MEKWRENLRKIQPYVPGEQPETKDIIKLNTNENPYPPAPGVERAVREFNSECLKLYPNAEVMPIVSALADYYGFSKEEVFVGVGSDDVLAVAFMALFNSQLPILFPDITYSFYDVWAELFHIPYQQIPLDDEFHIRTEDYLRPNGGIILANPNAPTSVGEPLTVIEKIISKNRDSITIIDEAYVDFGGESAIELVRKYPNLLIVQTFSKARSMAGMRVGYAIGNRELIHILNDVKYSYNSYTMNQPSLYYAVEAIKDKEYFESTLDKVIRTREWTKKELQRLGFTMPDSKTNFLFVSHEQVSANVLFTMLREHKILVRYFDKPRVNNYLRITIGTDEQMKVLVQVLDNYLSRTKDLL